MDLTINPTDFLFMFGLFMATILVLHVNVFKPTFTILREREHRLSGLKKEAEFFIKQQDEKIEAYQRLMGEARQLARQKREEIIKTAETESRDILQEASKAAEGFINQARIEISIQTKEAKLQLKKSTEDLAQDMVTRLLKRKVA